MVHLNEMAEKYEEKGVTILAIAKQPKADVEKFVDELKATHPIVCEKTDSARAYGARGFPSAYLIGPNGRIVWAGGAGATLREELLEEMLGKVKILPALPKGLAAHAKNMEKLKYGAVLAKVEGDLKAGRLTLAEDKAAAEALRDWLDWYATSNLEAADAQAGKGDAYAASLVLADVEETFKGHPLAAKAKAALSKLQADKANALEIKAGQMLAQIRKELGDEQKLEKIAEALKPLLAKKYAETKAGKAAAALAEGREPEAPAKEEEKKEEPKKEEPKEEKKEGTEGT